MSLGLHCCTKLACEVPFGFRPSIETFVKVLASVCLSLVTKMKNESLLLQVSLLGKMANWQNDFLL